MNDREPTDWVRLYSNFALGLFVDWRASDDLWRISHRGLTEHCATAAETQRIVDAALAAR